MVWKFIRNFAKLNGTIGKEYHNQEKHLDLSVGLNPNMTIPEKYFVHIEDSRMGFSGDGWFRPIQKWFTSAMEAEEFALQYMKKNR